ncbi:MAG: hypothetical protein UX81_C0003G0011 [Parcubacteria group bacterium GW2011_GWA2_47_12]|nr:MAG: hypothetical protein UX81_C0003G0011 [Parcubacteria group bacterium GW2011_GWA2_47_12]
MALDYSKHKNILLQILKDIYSDNEIAPYLGFKGGTAALLFYGLSRDSVDLDFDLLDESKEAEVFKKIQEIAASYGKIIDSRVKRFNLVTIISYELKAQHVKIEVNRRSFGSKYDLKTFLGISMLVMVREDMFAHKLTAMCERFGKAKCIDLLEKMDNKNILSGMGELLAEKQKIWARAKLKNDTIFLLKLMLESEKSNRAVK